MTDGALPLTVDGVLARTESLLNRHGWTQGLFGDPEDGGYCLLGALRMATVGQTSGANLFGNRAYISACRAVSGYLKESQWNTPTRSIMMFNDNGNTEVEDVMDVLSMARGAFRAEQGETRQ